MNATQIRSAQALRSLALVNSRSGSWTAHQERLQWFEDAGGLVCETSDNRSLAAALLTATATATLLATAAA